MNKFKLDEYIPGHFFKSDKTVRNTVEFSQTNCILDDKNKTLKIKVIEPKRK